jgi:YD repeat-containing protein
MMKITTIAVLVALALPLCAHAEEQTRLYDSNGRSIGTAVPQGEGTTRFYDARGRSTGTATTRSGTTTFYDAAGRVTGKASK